MADASQRALRKALAALLTSTEDSPEVNMAMQIIDEVLCQPEFVLAVRRSAGGFTVGWGEQNLKIEWQGRNITRRKSGSDVA